MERVTFSYGEGKSRPIELPIIKDFSVLVGAGEIVAMVGPSGCGKSTIARLVVGLLLPEQGHIRFKKSIIAGPSKERGFIAQGDWCLPWMSVKNNLVLGLSSSINANYFNSLVEMAGLTGYLDRYPVELSFGARQRVCLIRALIAGADLLVLDEPLSSVDAVRRLSMQQSIRHILKATGVSALWITHDLDEALLVSDRIMIVGKRPLTVLHQEPVTRSSERLISTIDSTEFQQRRMELQRLVVKLWPIEGDSDINETI
jgi:ABC-type nitrate/sulfonate/bicarbonate transport system ATPase subunit